MVFKPAPGIEGRVFIPEETPAAHKKHACADCYQCQLCSDDRCQLCQNHRECRPPLKTGTDVCGDHDGRPPSVSPACHR